jgi:alkylation response protein AidB-like acyl-CoA dehydrogenase
MMDKVGNKVARLEIAMIKVQAPRMALRFVDDAIQAHGGAGVTTDFELAKDYAGTIAPVGGRTRRSACPGHRQDGNETSHQRGLTIRLVRLASPEGAAQCIYPTS